MKVKNLLAGLCASALLLTACQASPKDSLVVHKNMESLISEAQTESEGKADAEIIREEVSEGERYQTAIENESLGVRVSVDAEVEVPDVDTLNIYRVRQVPFTQEFIDRVRAELLGNAPVYEGQTLTLWTKADWERSIGVYRENIRQLEESLHEAENSETAVPSAKELQESIDALQQEIDRMQQQYDAAPETADPKNYPADGQICSRAALSARMGEDASQLSNPEAPALDLVTAGETGPYARLYLEGDGVTSSLHYSQNAMAYVIPNCGRDFLSAAADAPQNDAAPENFLSSGADFGSGAAFYSLDGVAASMTQAEAEQEARAFLDAVGLDAFIFDVGGRYCEQVRFVRDADRWDAEGTPYLEYYILRFRRQLGGVMLAQTSGSAVFRSEDSAAQTVYWPEETVEIRINDSGIVGFDYSAPLEVTETAVENAALRPFSEIRKTFETMICVTNAVEDPNLRYRMRVKRVRLSYSRVSEPDSGETGLIVPVWSFEGDRDFLFAAEHMEWSEQDVCFLNVNAIDGSVIVPELGY